MDALLDALLNAIIADDAESVVSDLARDPALALARMREDRLIESIHWLYVGDTPLHLAAAALHAGIVEALLKAGAKVDAVNRRGASPLHYACDPRPAGGVWNPPEQERIIDLLVAAGAPVDLAGAGGVTPLHRAVRARSPRAVLRLCAAGANVGLRLKKGGSTPLHLAVSQTGAGGTSGTVSEQLEIIATLLAHGASPNRPDGRGISPLGLARTDAIRAALQS